ALDADAIERYGAVNQTAAVRLRDDDEIFRARVVAELAAHRRGAARSGFGTHLAQNAEPTLRDAREIVLPIVCLEAIAAETEEEEVAIVEPAQECARFVDLLLGHGKRLLQFVDVR